jgi:uncharacterized protein with von Willebrand factor type A (vWA) domain
MAKKQTQEVIETAFDATTGAHKPVYTPVVKADDYDRFIFSDLHGRSETLQDLEPMGLVSDVFASFYKSSPDLSSAPAKPLFEALYETQEYKNLRNYTKYEDVTSGMATLQVAPQLVEQYLAIEEELKKEHDRQEKNRQNGGEPLPMSEECKDAIAGARAAMRECMKEAGEEAEQVTAAMRTFGVDKNSLNRANLDDRWELASQVAENKDFTKVIELLGRMKNLAVGAMSLVPSHGVEEIVDVTLGDDLAALVPTELLKFQMTPVLFFKDYYEKNLTVYEKTGTDQASQGPLVVCIDISPSMSGERAQWASAFTLALIEMAQRQKRAFHFLTFGVDVHDRLTLQKGQTASFEERIQIASLECNGGGTNFYVPLAEAFSFVEQSPNFSKADILFVTDGEYSFKDKELKNLKQRKEKGVRVHSIAIQPFESPESLVQISDSLTIFNSLNDMQNLSEIFKSTAS